MKRFSLSSALCLLLTACASTQTTTYYQLSDNVFRQPESNKQVSGSLKSVRVKLADVLNNRSMVYQTSDVSLSFSNHNLWAGKLTQSIENILANDLNNNTSQVFYLPQSVSKSSPSIDVYIQRFQGVFDGTVEVAGYAYHLDTQGKIVKIIPFHIKEVQSGDGYAAMANALSQAVHKLATQIQAK